MSRFGATISFYKHLILNIYVYNYLCYFNGPSPQLDYRTVAFIHRPHRQCTPPSSAAPSPRNLACRNNRNHAVKGILHGSYAQAIVSHL